MSEEIHIKQTLPLRARPDLLYRLVLEPRRRLSWDPHFVKAEYVGPEARLVNNALVEFKFVRRLLGLRFQARYGHLQGPQRGGWESVKPVGPLEKLSQLWSFKAVPGGTEVTMTLKASVRYKWVRPQLERVLQHLVYKTLLELQRQVDASSAELLEDMNRELLEKQKAERRQKKKRK